MDILSPLAPFLQHTDDDFRLSSTRRNHKPFLEISASDTESEHSESSSDGESTEAQPRRRVRFSEATVVPELRRPLTEEERLSYYVTSDDLERYTDDIWESVYEFEVSEKTKEGPSWAVAHVNEGISGICLRGLEYSLDRTEQIVRRKNRHTRSVLKAQKRLSKKARKLARAGAWTPSKANDFAEALATMASRTSRVSRIHASTRGDMDAMVVEQADKKNCMGSSGSLHPQIEFRIAAAYLSSWMPWAPRV